jgi:DNA modification methylase/superfamily II DNA or RNA helicase
MGRSCGEGEKVEYAEFLESKKVIVKETGFDAIGINPMLFDFQKDIVRWALKKGKAAIFADCGLGKTPMQLEWARHVCQYTGGNVLILAPLAVSKQTVREGRKFGIEVNVCRTQGEVKSGINITNYEMLQHFQPEEFAGIILDESSILKAHDGKTRNNIIESFRDTPYKLACTATPAPNDFMELGNHSEFLGVMNRTEMLAMFFVHDGGDTAKWRLKGHAQEKFWEWIASWAVLIRKPSDLGYDNGKFTLPNLELHQHTVKVNSQPIDTLFHVDAQTLQERQQARKASIDDRVQMCAELVNKSSEPWLIWCNLNAESEALTRAINGAIEVKGADSNEHKENSMIGFTEGTVRIIVTKPSIAGYGMNWQHCSNMAFVGLSDSYEEFYQAVRRCWRFGQENPVQVHVITAETEGAVVKNIQRKEEDAAKMADGMINQTQEITRENIRGTHRDNANYEFGMASGKNWTLHLGDCVEEIQRIPSNSIHYSVFSPPFASLYTYSNSERDMGNCKGQDEFLTHFKFLVKELYRVIMPGRLVSIHCMDIPMMKERDGVIGLKDFPAQLRSLFGDEGFIYHSKVTIWKDPVIEMQRTKALGLLHKQVRKDSAMCRQGLPDYLLTMRKPGGNPEPIPHTHEEFPVNLWQKYASPVWFDINQSNTLQKLAAREEEDEKHICPLQLDVIERAIMLWTNEKDTVLSPFAGIGSEGYQALKMGRKFIGFELKKSYYETAKRNLEMAEIVDGQCELF